MALIGEADFKGNFGNCASCFLQELGRASDSAMCEIFMRRLPRALSEGAVKVPLGQSRKVRQILGL